MIQIRGNTFETNSSSAHSFVITNGKPKYYTHQEALGELHFMRDGIWTPWDDMYFGRHPFQVLCTFRDKLRYAYANAPVRKNRMKKSGYQGYRREYYQITRIVNRIIPEYKGVKFRNKCIGTDDGMLFGWLKDAGITLREFLLNKNIIVICDGDEYCIWYDMKKSGLINKDNIKLELPKTQWFEELDTEEVLEEDKKDGEK